MAFWEDAANRELKLPSGPSLRPAAKKQKRAEAERNVDEDPSTHSAHRKPGRTEDILDFLRTRPQIVKLQKDFLQGRTPTEEYNTRTVAGQEASELVHSDRFQGSPGAWQQSETIDEFLKRLPVTDPNTADVGPWLWVSRPSAIRSQHERGEKADVKAFCLIGGALLQAFIKQRDKVESESPGKAPTTITRKMGPYRDQLEEDLLSAAVKTGMPQQAREAMIPRQSSLSS